MIGLKAIAASTLLCSTLSVDTSESIRLNINDANASEIDQSLVFVSINTAKKIVEHREKHGRFSSVNKIAEVKGVSKRLVRYNRSRISLD